MLRVDCLQLFYNLSNPTKEDSLYNIESMRRFAGLRLSDQLHDETTILNFRHLLETHGQGKALFVKVNSLRAAQGLMLREGSMMDATMLPSPRPTKNKDGNAILSCTRPAGTSSGTSA